MSEVLVSVYCLAYNCKDYIENALKGMLSQKTNFKYEIVIHDDASTDGTKEIIQSYVNKYPDKFCAILNEVNQYSQGIDIYEKFISPNIKGKYVAVCEGDDEWIDENKLQRQFDYMEEHPECSMCVHNTIRHDLSNSKDSLFNNWEEIHIMNEEEVFVNWDVHTSSYFIRKKYMNWPFSKRYWFGDYLMITWAFVNGQIVSLPQVMSKYNMNNATGVMKKNSKLSISEQKGKEYDRIDFLNEINVITNGKYIDIINKKKSYIEYMCLGFECEQVIMGKNSCKQKVEAAKKMILHPYYKHTYKNKKKIMLFKARFRYEGYKVYPLWMLIRKLYM